MLAKTIKSLSKYETLSKYYSVYEIYVGSLDVNYSSYHYWKNNGKNLLKTKWSFYNK